MSGKVSRRSEAGPTPVDIADQLGWGHDLNPVAITSTISHQTKGRYF
jgi:hypothetical protein